jgi:NTP pyrophosphatase (non-canonical NTP hydrolase)
VNYKKGGIMTFEEYQEKALATDLTGTRGDWKNVKNLEIVLGLCGETGEVAEKFKKLIRDHDCVVTDDYRREIAKELGDVLWYITAIASHIGVNLEDIAKDNNEKLSSRAKRDQLHGAGDNR